MAYKNYILKGVVTINDYNKETNVIKYSMAVINNKSGSLLWRAPDLEYKTISKGRKALINLNQAARVVVWNELNLPRSTVIRIEVANTKDALKMLPPETKVMTSKPAKIEKMEMSDTDKKYAVVCQNGVWTIKKFDVPVLVTKEEALEILLSK